MLAATRTRTALLSVCLLIAGFEQAVGDVRQDLDLGSPDELEQELWDEPERIPELYRTWGARLVQRNMEEPDDQRLLNYAVAVASRRAERLFGSEDPTGQHLDLLLAMLQIDPPRFFGDESFRRRVAGTWVPLTDSVPSPEARLRLVERLASRGLDDFVALEIIAAGWGLIERPTDDRERIVEAQASPGSVDGVLGPIETSIFSLPPFLGIAESARLLVSVHAAAPHRRMLVFADRQQSRNIHDMMREFPGGPAAIPSLTFLPTLGFDYSPWPRDPLTLARRADGGVHVVLRGNVQRGREADEWLGRALVQGLPQDLDGRWGEPTWHRAELPFHNGQILDTDDASWVSVHSLEPRILQLLGMDRLPVERFDGEDGRRYVEAARLAASELAQLRGRPVRFVHPLPSVDLPGSARAEKLHELAGGAGIDLDSVLTLLPQVEGPARALVADLDLGTELVTAPETNLEGLSAYGLPVGRAKDLIVAGHKSSAARSLDLFLDQVTVFLEGEGLAVRRLPLLMIEPASTNRSDRADLAPFLLTWNNVVLDRLPFREVTGWFAEGFASGLPAGDQSAVRAFAESGFRLRLHPPLVESIVRNGGYRCSSQHVRMAEGVFLD